MAKKRKKRVIPNSLLLICILTGIATLVLRMLNRDLKVTELGEIAGYAGTAFTISLILIIGIWLISVVNKR